MRRRAAIVLVLLVSGWAASGVQATEISQAERRSGAAFMSADSVAMQNDDTTNPGMLSVLDGETIWNARTGAAGRSCADCHGDARASMRGVAARYPAFDETLGRAVDLEQRVNLCRVQHQQATPLAYESRDLLALAALIGRQSRGMPIASGTDPRLQGTVTTGKALFMRRQGQLNLSCSNCHDDNWDRHLAGAAMTQGHPTGYPLYRLEWQSVGSLQRRLRNCMIGTRAQPYDNDAPEMIALELYLMVRARGMAVETPGVRP